MPSQPLVVLNKRHSVYTQKYSNTNASIYPTHAHTQMYIPIITYNMHKYFDNNSIKM